MVLYNKTNVVLACLVSSTVAAIRFDPIDIAGYKAGIPQMVSAGSDLPQRDTNQALATYSEEQKRLESLKGEGLEFNRATKKRINALACLTKVSPSYSKALSELTRSMTKTEYDQQKAAALTRAAAVQLAALLTPMGLTYNDECGNFLRGHKAFLEANQTLKPEAARMLKAASYLLYYFSGQTRRKIGTRTPFVTQAVASTTTTTATTSTTTEGKQE